VRFLRLGAALVLSTALVACGEEVRRVPAPSSDGGGARLDAGGAGDDAAAPDDAGQPQDAAPFDSGLGPRPDGGPEPDAGFVDTGVATDGGVVTDSGLPPADGGGVDATVPSDSGVVGDAGPAVDAGPSPDAGPAVDAGLGMDGGTTGPASPDPAASAAIAMVRAAADGTVAIRLDRVLVTYLKPATGTESAGFFVQAEKPGPGLWVPVNPSTLSPPPQIGDVVGFQVDRKSAHTGGVIEAAAISGFTVYGAVADVAPFVQDVSTANDLVSAAASYEAELVQAEVTITSALVAAGTSHVAGRVATAGLPGSADLELRMPSTLANTLGLGVGCTVGLDRVPVWRFRTKTQLSPYAAGDVLVRSCRPARAVQAFSLDATRVVLTFDRPIAASSISATGAEISFDNGLTASAAVVDGSVVVVTTSAQTTGTNYTLTIAATVTDAQGTPIDAAGRTVAFAGAPTEPHAWINEVGANLADDCDLVELRVLRGGSLNGWTLSSRGDTLVTFAGLSATAESFVLVHLNGGSPTCNPGMLANETMSPSELSSSANVATAFDWYSPIVGLPGDATTLILRDAGGQVRDAVLLAGDRVVTPDAATTMAASVAAMGGAWTAIDGTVPMGGFTGVEFGRHAVLDLDGTATDRLGRSIQRFGNADTNSASGWNDANDANWGRNNRGQSAF
jgi:hypothetical protein